MNSGFSFIVLEYTVNSCWFNIPKTNTYISDFFPFTIFAFYTGAWAGKTSWAFKTAILWICSRFSILYWSHSIYSRLYSFLTWLKMILASSLYEVFIKKGSACGKDIDQSYREIRRQEQRRSDGKVVADSRHIGITSIRSKFNGIIV